MPRNLPWLSGGSSTMSSRTSQARTFNSVASISAEDAQVEASTSRQQATPRSRKRTPSTSPPPQPPAPEYMQAGLDKDDIFIMVEDEFLSTARTFTSHLHHAEYKRLKQIAKAQNASVTQSISRPVDPRAMISEEAKRQAQAAQLRRIQKESIAGLGTGEELEVDELDEEYDDPWMRDTRLAGLMSGSLVEHDRLDSLAGGMSRTRAAAGFLKPSSHKGQEAKFHSHPTKTRDVRHREQVRPAADDAETESEDENDQDLSRMFKSRNSLPGNSSPNRRSTRTVYHLIKPPVSTGSYSSPLRASETKTEPHSSSAKRQGPAESGANKASTRRTPPGESDFDVPILSPKRELALSGLRARMEKRKAEMAERERAKKTKAALLFDEIPTFLI